MPGGLTERSMVGQRNVFHPRRRRGALPAAGFVQWCLTKTPLKI
jgi:hypothetical protein